MPDELKTLEQEIKEQENLIQKLKARKTEIIQADPHLTTLFSIYDLLRMLDAITYHTGILRGLRFHKQGGDN